MRLSRFVVTYSNVRPGEHVLFDVIKDHYVGVDDATLEAVDAWSTGGPRDEDEAEVQRVLQEEGLLVEDTAEDDARLRRFLEGAAEGIPGGRDASATPLPACLPRAGA